MLLMTKKPFNPSQLDPEIVLARGKNAQPEIPSKFIVEKILATIIHNYSLAYAEMRLILARLLWNFDLSLPPSSGNWIKQEMFILWQKEPLNIILKERV
jgi:hypothetical protein